jgi:hypothetical protein
MGIPNPPPRSPVLITLGPEWAPLKAIVQAWLRDHPAEIGAIALLDPNPARPVGRIAGWIAEGSRAELVVPGGTGHPARRGWAGVTELLLDPDPSQVEQLYALGIWTRFATRTNKLRMRISPTLSADIVAMASDFSPELFALVGEWRGNRVVIVGTDPIATEVVSRAFRAFAAPAGDTGLSPWQAPIVQAAIEQGLGITSGSAMSIDARISRPIAPPSFSEAADLIEQICQRLDTVESGNEIDLLR